jgi:methylmalonyl-CoA mutase
LPLLLSGGASPGALAAFAAEAGARGALGLHVDPLGALGTAGMLPCPLKALYDEAAGLARGGVAAPSPVLAVDAYLYHEAAADAVSEVAFALATGAAHLRGLVERSVPADEAASRIGFRMAAGPRFFTEVAKLRAARSLWDHVAASFGCSEAARAMHLHVRTSAWALSRLDPHTNLLRSTVAAVAAVLAGAQRITVAPYDEPLGARAELARRLARGVQLILREESYLDRVVDAAGGSWYVEWLTDALARRAWELFVRLEEEGGMLAALVAGLPQRLAAESAAARAAAVARGARNVIGANRYAVLEPKGGGPASGVAGGRPSAGAGGGRPSEGASLEELVAERTAATGPGERAPLLGSRRIAEAFERLRDEARGGVARAHLAGVGSAASRRARIEFTQGLLATGGIESVVGQAASVEEAVEEAARSGAPVVVACSADETYGALVPALARLRADGRALAVAGRVPEGAAWAGLVDAQLYRGCDAVAVLGRLQRKMGVTP